MAIKVISQPKPKKMRGTCTHCKTRVECDKSDTTTLIDRDTVPGCATQHVKCPGCGDEFLWVR